MKKNIVLATALAISTSVLGACSGTTGVNNVPVKPPTTPTPVIVASPTTPSVKPATSTDAPNKPEIKPTVEVKTTTPKTTESPKK